MALFTDYHAVAYMYDRDKNCLSGNNFIYMVICDLNLKQYGFAFSNLSTKWTAI